MNNYVLVGRVKEIPEITTTSKGTTLARMLVETDRNFRNDDGTLSTDVFQVTLWRGIAEECSAICKPGSLVAVKGRLKGDQYEKNNVNYYNTEIIAEKVSFLERP